MACQFWKELTSITITMSILLIHTVIASITLMMIIAMLTSATITILNVRLQDLGFGASCLIGQAFLATTGPSAGSSYQDLNHLG